MRTGWKYLSPLIALLPVTAARASEDSQIWLTSAAVVRLSDKWRVSGESVARFSDDRDGLYEIEVNLLLGYRVADKVTLWAGYTHDPNYDGGNFAVMEHRGRQQVTFDNIVRIGPGRLSARLRTEERWRDGVDGTAWRVRPYVKYSLPLDKSGRTALVLSHESFIDLNRSNFQRVRGEERMRNLVAITTPLSKRIAVEIGYLHQHGFRPGAPDSNDHVASLALAASF
ncbi:DUF2490 domain-containing protein [Sphingobium amiense]|uniref:DUF2490 domain-containing protein n=1 Tax=Sphingobium amiense TaxID=135719 RepID=A0A494VVQ7_9SPHN|nr:DUF2490 domain-containing protein [Sphingobium amiense]BBD96503.1 DUF2490 domain-containing protein [Sphingobium amiense]